MLGSLGQLQGHGCSATSWSRRLRELLRLDIFGDNAGNLFGGKGALSLFGSAFATGGFRSPVGYSVMQKRSWQV